MKLNNTIREHFVSSVMRDVPQTDYIEMIRSAVFSDIVNNLPPNVRAVYDDPATRNWVKMDFNQYARVSVTHPSDTKSPRRLTVETMQKIEAWRKAGDAQDAIRLELREKLKAVAYSCSTRKALAEALPEFERYLPADKAAAVRTVPAIANVVSDFVRAGWPSGKAST